MDFEFLGMLMQLLVALVITLLIMFLSYKVLGTKVNNLNKNKYIKIIEKSQLSKDNSIFIVKIGKKGYVMTSTSQSMEKIDELNEDDIKEIEDSKEQANAEMMDEYNKFVLHAKDTISTLINKIKSKEGRNEKK